MADLYDPTGNLLSMPVDTEDEKVKRIKELQAEKERLVKIRELKAEKIELETQRFGYQKPLSPKEEKIQELKIEKQALIDKHKTKTLKLAGESFMDFLKDVWAPFPKLFKEYRKERGIAAGMVKTGVSKDKTLLQRLAGVGFGTMQYIMSPLTALGKSSVREPITGTVGLILPPKAAEFAGRLGEEAMYFVPVASAIRKSMMLSKPAITAAEKMGLKQFRVPKAPPGSPLLKKEISKKAQTIRRQIDEAEMAPTKAFPEELAEARVKQELVNDITGGAEDALKGNFDKSQRIFKQIGEKLAIGEISPAALPELLKKYNMTPVQFAKMYEETVSYGGRILSYHSRAKKSMMKILKDEPEALKLMEEAFKKESNAPYMIDKAMEIYGNVDNFRRAMLVGQVATSMRNFWSQAGRLSISALDESLQAVMGKTLSVEGKHVGPKLLKSSINEVGRDLNNLTRYMLKMKPANRSKLHAVLEENQAVLQKMRLFSQPVHEIQLGGKLSGIVNTLNRGQEFFFRRIAFEGKLRQRLKKKGLDFDGISPDMVPEDDLVESVNYALEMTFAASPKSNTVQRWVQSWTNIPGATLIQPFPRFMLGNAIPFLIDHSPLGYLKAMKPSVIADLASGNPERFIKHASRATMGNLMLDSAMHLRQSKYAGDRWYEINTGRTNERGEPEIMDTRAFAPFSTYLFVAQAMIDPSKLKPSDWSNAFIGLNRVAGTGLVVSDWLRAKDLTSWKKSVLKFVGQTLGGFTVPLRSFSDIYGTVDEEENVWRDWKESPIIGPTLQNIPELSQMLPEKPSPVSTKRMIKAESIKTPFGEIPGGIMRQFSGLSKRSKTVLQTEIDTLPLEWTAVYPKTGIPEGDRAISRLMAPNIEKFVVPFIKSPQYKILTVERKQIVLSQLLSKFKTQAKIQLAGKDSDLFLRVMTEGLGKRKKKILEGEETF